MKKIIIKQGFYAVVVLLTINILSLVFIGTDPSGYGMGEIVGYSAIVLSLLFVFLGIRQYDLQNNGSSFLSNLAIGSGISFFPSLWFGIYNVIYVKWIDPNFIENYKNYSLENMMASMSPEQFEISKAKMLEELAMFDNLFAQFLIMFMTVFIIGLIITVLSSMFLKLKPIKP